MDWVTDKLYFTDASLDIVGVFDPNGPFNHTVLIRTGDNTQPRAIVLDPNARLEEHCNDIIISKCFLESSEQCIFLTGATLDV